MQNYDVRRIDFEPQLLHSSLNTREKNEECTKQEKQKKGNALLELPCFANLRRVTALQMLQCKRLVIIAILC